jgi:hypothetical protein
LSLVVFLRFGGLNYTKGMRGGRRSSNGAVTLIFAFLFWHMHTAHLFGRRKRGIVFRREISDDVSRSSWRFIMRGIHTISLLE